METWGVVFLGIIAASSVIQAIFLVGVMRTGQRLGQRVEELQKRIDREIQPGLDNLTRLTRNVADISDVATREVLHLTEALALAIDRVEDTVRAIPRTILRPLGPIGDVIALIKGVRHGIEVYQELGEVRRTRRAPARSYSEDEHLFI
jgi:hypothetical protein